jgi:hypothetical protein
VQGFTRLRAVTLDHLGGQLLALLAEEQRLEGSEDLIDFAHGLFVSRLSVSIYTLVYI